MREKIKNEIREGEGSHHFKRKKEWRGGMSLKHQLSLKTIIIMLLYKMP